MSSRSVFLGKLIGFYAIFIALSMFARKQVMVAAVTALFHDPSFLIIYGVIALGVGLAIVLGHNVWSGGVLPITVTIVGWLSTIKGLVLLFASPDALGTYVQTIRYEQLYYLYAAFTLAIGALLTYSAFTAPQERPGT
ncbi:MAG: hypothetical protein JO104_01990 [Candidatus Eremiobacteraeota bacterium]|nr:hypothetical protein [Candidatus Eremiobacteraeota bacterium]